MNDQTPSGTGQPSSTDGSAGSNQVLDDAQASFRSGNWKAAVAACDTALSNDPTLTQALFLKAKCLVKLERFEDAQSACEQAVSVNPTDAIGRVSAVRILEDIGGDRHRERAAFHYQRAISMAQSAASGAHTSVAEIHHQIGAFRLQRSDAPAAVEALRQALLVAEASGISAATDLRAEIEIDYSDALMRLGLKEEAQKAMERSTATESEETLFRLAEVAFRFNFWKVAAWVLQKCVQHDPQSGQAWFKLADLLAKTWRLEEAAGALKKAEECGFAPISAAHALRAFIASRVGDPERAYEVYKRLVDDGLVAYRSNLVMTSLYCDHLSPQDVSDLHRKTFLPLAQGARNTSTFRNDLSANRPLRIGMVTPDMHRQHPVNIFLQPMMRHWNYDGFPLTIYFTGKNHDEQTRLAQSRASAWREPALDKLAQQIEADEIDILFDLAGHTDARLVALFAKRMAPVQVSFLGYAGSTGVPNTDWIIGDPIMTPPEHDHLYPERVARLPHTAFCYAPEHDYPYPAFENALQERALTFGCFNNVPKLTPGTIRVWSDILRELPNARLLLKAPSFQNPAAAQRFSGMFQKHGIDPERLEFRGPVSLERMMQEYADVDIGLDPFPHNGGTTTLQAMWMGVPMITKAGGLFQSRMGASFNHAAGMEDWTASSEEDYVRIAVEKAQDRAGLLDLKRGLRQRLIARPGWQTGVYIEDFSALLRSMWPPRKDA